MHCHELGVIEELLKINYQGSVGYLVEKELEELSAYLDKNLPKNVKEVIHYVSEHYGITYTERGMQMGWSNTPSY